MSGGVLIEYHEAGVQIDSVTRDAVPRAGDEVHLYRARKWREFTVSNVVWLDGDCSPSVEVHLVEKVDPNVS
jgi:hypothetical protein